MKKLVLFGAGVYAKMYKSLLDYLNIPFDYYTDNDSSKYGLFLYGKEVIDPNTLPLLDCNVIISCSHGEAIKEQLKGMGILDRLISLEDICEIFKERISEKTMKYKNMKQQKTVLVDMYEGIGWGGTEMWAASVAKGLLKRGYPVALLGSQEQESLSKEYEDMVERFSCENTIEQMVSYMLDRLPFVLLNNFSGCAYLAAVMLKMQYPKQVEIIDVIHNDNISLFNSHMVFREWVNGFICVSDKIRNSIISLYHIEEEKVFFKEQPILSEKDFQRKYIKEGPLRIGYAARLVKQQKRADLFPTLIDMLEKYQMPYLLEIAGEGECKCLIEEYISKNYLEDRVKVLGRIPKEDMPQFWKKQDVYLNFSEYEGTSLSMLEAMSFACVPVVTDVSGVSEFITNEYNGCVCHVGDLDSIAKEMYRLGSHRELLSEYGGLCQNIIQTRCNPDDYMEYIDRVIQRVSND